MKFNVYITILLGLLGLIHSEQTWSESSGCKHNNNISLACNYIPKDIPKGIKKFRLEMVTSIILNPFTFQGKHWKKLEYLEFTQKNKLHHLTIAFKDNCLKQLEALKELHIHIWHPEVSGGSFSGTKSVKTLDFRRCGRFSIEEFKLALNGSNILPALNKVILSDWNYYGGSYNFDDELIEILHRRNITELNLSKSQISNVNLTHFFKKLIHIEVLNLSYAVIGDDTDTYITQQDVKHIKIIDLSHAVLPKKSVNVPPGKMVLHDVVAKLSDSRSAEDNKAVCSPDSLNISGIIPHVTSIWLYNVSYFIDRNLSCTTRSIIARQNNWKRADIKMTCDNYYSGTIETFDISENNMEFLHPSILSCLKNLINLDLSKNQLYKMAEENNTLFEGLFSGLNFLKSIQMQANGLHKIPTKLFEKVKSIEAINLSKNYLKQVTFNLGDLEKLKVLNLCENKIHILDSRSINFLNSLPTGNNDSVILDSNPISCSACESKPFILWLTSTNLVGTGSGRLNCLDEDGKYVIIDDKTVDVVESICHRKVIRTAVGVSAAVAAVLTISCVMIIYRRQKHLRRNRKRSNVINNLRNGEGQYHFAVFLSYSGKDEDFVSTYVLDQLEENLRLMTGVERSLVCTGDKDFHLGINIEEETFRLLDSASVLVVVISNNFLTSNACKSEIEKAYGNKKPIVLMLIEQVDCALMNRTTKSLFENNTRILWTVENGMYKPKTTWENICTSVLDLITE